MKIFPTAIKFSLFLSLSISLSAQITTSSQWTWVKGDNTVNTPGIYGTMGVAAPANKPGARAESVSWTDAAGNLWLFGGDGNFGSDSFNDLWKYNPSTNQWTWVNGASTTNQLGVYGTLGTVAATNNPGGRQGSGSWTDASGNFWLFGGAGYAASGSGYSYLNDLWKYNLATNQWTWVNGASTAYQSGIYGTLGTAAPSNRPGARYQSVTWTDASGNLWLFGGGKFNDLWKYNIATNLWTWVKGDSTENQQGIYGTLGTAAATNKPGARGASVTWTDALGKLWLFGGDGSVAGIYTIFNDLWKYDPVINQWTWVKGDSTGNQQGLYGTIGTAAATNKPGARGGSFRWMDASGNFWLFGGYSRDAANNDVQLNDLWKYDLPTNQWTWIKGDNIANQKGIYGTIGTAAATNKPGARGFNVSWIDLTGNFWLFGGDGYSAITFGNLNDLWKLSNVSILPVTLISFKAYQQNNNNNIAVEWKVENESGIKQYDVEKSRDGIMFAKVAVQAVTGNNISTVNYAWIDVNAFSDNNFYRIRSVGLDGVIKYSSVVKVTIGKGKPGYEVYSNPVTNGIIQLQFINQAKGIYYVRLLNAFGQVMLIDQIAHETGSSTEAIKPGSHIVKGNYFIEVTAPDKSRQSMKIIF